MAPPDPPSPRTSATFGTPEIEAGLGRARDRFGLAALFRVDAGIGACGIDQRQNRDVEAVRHLHQAHRLAIAFRPRHAEIVLQPGFGARALFVTDDADAFAAEAAETADDRIVVAELAVAGERHEIGDQGVDEFETMRALRMARDLGFLPGRQFFVEFPQRLRRLGLKPRDFLFDLDLAAVGLNGAQFLDLGFEFGKRFFEIEVGAHRSHKGCGQDGPRPGANGPSASA